MTDDHPQIFADFRRLKRISTQPLPEGRGSMKYAESVTQQSPGLSGFPDYPGLQNATPQLNSEGVPQSRRNLERGIAVPAIDARIESRGSSPDRSGRAVRPALDRMRSSAASRGLASSFRSSTTTGTCIYQSSSSAAWHSRSAKGERGSSAPAVRAHRIVAGVINCELSNTGSQSPRPAVISRQPARFRIAPCPVFPAFSRHQSRWTRTAVVTDPDSLKLPPNELAAPDAPLVSVVITVCESLPCDII